MHKLLIASHNVAKIQEIKQFLETLLPKAHLVTLTDLNITDAPEETGKTFQENAEIKARYYAHISSLPTLSDDGGLIIDSLNGEPGVRSNRWLGYEATPNELINYCLKRMKSVPSHKRTARFQTCMYFFNPIDHRSKFELASVEGIIAQEANKKTQVGYAYRSVFIVNKFKKFYFDLTDEENEQINHRLLALKRLAQKLKTWYN